MTDLDPALRSTIDDLFAARVRDGRTPGAYYALFDRDGLIAEGGFGEAWLGGPVPNADTAFRIASCTKSFTSNTLLALRDRGLLNLDSPITDFVSSFVPNTPASDPVTPTVRMLMSMSGGLPTDDPWGDRQEAWSRADLDAYLALGVPTVSVPGTAFEYSNLGYALLGQVIAAVTEKSYFDAVRDEIFEPLGLESTGYETSVVPASRLALGYRRLRGEWIELPFSDKGVFSSMGGIFSTGRDLARWAAFLAAADSASIREQQQIQRAIPDPGDTTLGYGFGLFVEYDPVFGKIVHHSGGYPGFSTHMSWSSETGIGIVAFENATYSGALVPAIAALRLVLERVGAPSPSPTPWPATVEMQARATALVREWDDATADAMFTANVADDIPYVERRQLIADAVAQIGEVDWSAVARDVAHASPAQASWSIPGSHGELRFDLLLAPTNPPLVQRLSVRSVSSSESPTEASM